MNVIFGENFENAEDRNALRAAMDEAASSASGEDNQDRATKRPTVEFFLPRPQMLDAEGLWAKVKARCELLGVDFDTYDQDKKFAILERFVTEQELEMKNWESKLAEFNYQMRVKANEDSSKAARKEAEMHFSTLNTYDNGDGGICIGDVQIALIALDPAIPDDKKVSKFRALAKERIEKIHPGFFSVMDDRADSKLMHHGMCAGILITLGGFLVADYKAKCKSVEFRSECNKWHECYAALLMAIIKGDTTGNCKNTYHAAMRVSHAKSVEVKVANMEEAVAAFKGPVKVYLNAVFKAALDAHSRDPAVAKKALATATLKTHTKPKSLEKNAQEIKKSIQGEVYPNGFPKEGA